MKALPTDGFAVVLGHPIVHRVTTAEVECDDENWGEMTLEAAQARLEKADDLAILVLRSRFTAAEALEGLTIDVNAEGLRMLDVGGTYLVPLARQAPEGFERYALPSPLLAGDHAVTWSFVWQPPRDRSSGEALAGGVTLSPLMIRGKASVRDGALAAAPQHLDVSDPSLGGLCGAEGGLSFEREIALSLGAGQIELRGEGALFYAVQLGNLDLPRAGETTARFHLPPGADGAHTLRLIPIGPARPLQGIALI